MVYNRVSNTYHNNYNHQSISNRPSSPSPSPLPSTVSRSLTTNNPRSLRTRIRNILIIFCILFFPCFYWYWYEYTPEALLSYISYQYSPIKCPSSSSTYYTYNQLDHRQLSIIDPLSTENTSIIWPKIIQENPYKKYGPKWGPGCIVVCTPPTSFGNDRVTYASQYLSIYQNNNDRMNGIGNKINHNIPIPTSSSSFASSINYYHPYYCAPGLIGVRYCGVVNAKYGGRSANAFIQYAVARYTASTLNFGIKLKPIPGFGLLPEDIRDMCPPKVRWPWQYNLPEYRQLIQDSGSEERKGIDNFYDNVLNNKQPRSITTDWYFEKSDIVIASLLHGMRTSIQKSNNIYNIQQFIHPSQSLPTYSSSLLDIHPWLPSKVIDSYKALQNLMNKNNQNTINTVQNPELYLFQDEKRWDETIVVHVRIGDVGVWTWRRAIIEHYRQQEWLEQYPEVQKYYEQYQTIQKQYPSSDININPSLLTRLLLKQPTPLPENNNNYSWFSTKRWNLEWFDFLHKDDSTGRWLFNHNLPGWEKFKDINYDNLENKEIRQLLLQFLEDDFVSSQHIVLPLSYYNHILEKLMNPSTIESNLPKIKHVLIVTEPESIHHPLIINLANKWNAYIQSSSVAMDFATLMYAKHIILSTSTFSWAAALLGRAKTIHYPHAGYFSIFSDKDQCLVVPPELDVGLQYLQQEMSELINLNPNPSSPKNKDSDTPGSSSNTNNKQSIINFDYDKLSLFTTFNKLMTNTNTYNSKRIIYHDVYRMKIEQKLSNFYSNTFQQYYQAILEKESLSLQIQESLADYQYCLEKFPNQSSLFLTYNELINYYRDLRCINLAIRFTDAARPYELINKYSLDNNNDNNNNITVPLCIDKFQDLPF